MVRALLAPAIVVVVPIVVQSHLKSRGLINGVTSLEMDNGITKYVAGTSTEPSLEYNAETCYFLKGWPRRRVA